MIRLRESIWKNSYLARVRRVLGTLSSKPRAKNVVLGVVPIAISATSEAMGMWMRSLSVARAAP